MLLDLADKLAAPPSAAAAIAPAAPRAGGPSQADRLAGALTNMGFKPAQVERALGALRPKLAEARLEEVLREALALLAR